MKALVQRVSRAAVHVGDERVGSIDKGLCVFVGAGHDDDESDAEQLADRICHLRVFEDEIGKMNYALDGVDGGVLLVSQFTLMADTRRGRRPSFVSAAVPERAEPLIAHMAERIRAKGIEVATGRFGAHMDIEIAADGPVTLLLDTREKRSG